MPDIPERVYGNSLFFSLAAEGTVLRHRSDHEGRLRQLVQHDRIQRRLKRS